MNWFKRLLTAKKVGGLILRIIIMLVIPYIYLIICGLVFDKWLHMYDMTSFIFWSLMALWFIAVIFSILAIVWFVKRPKGNAPAEEEQKAEQ